jgi:hypothetical protein
MEEVGGESTTVDQILVFTMEECGQEAETRLWTERLQSSAGELQRSDE